MFCKSSLGFVLFLGLLVGISKAAQAPHTPEVDQPKECAENQNFCMAFCLSTNPGTVRARCGKDKISCICTTKAGHSVKVRFIEERKPVPPTRPPPPNQIQYPNPDFAYQSHQPHQPQQHHQNPSWNAEVPQLLVCDGAEVHMEVCHRFCIYNIGATMGVCNLTDFTCSCIGVSPAVVQDVPIPAIFTENIFLPSDSTTSAPPTTPPPMLQYIPEPQHYWSPITPNHPNYYYTQNQHLAPFQQTLRTQQAPEYPTEQFQQTQHQFSQPMESDPWHPIVNGQNQFQQTQAEVDSSEFPPADSMTNATPPTSSVSSPSQGMDGHHLPISTGAMMEPTAQTSANDNVTYSVQKSVEVHETHQAEPSSYRPQHLPMQLALDKYENHRNKRSKRSYASVLSYGISDTSSCYEQPCGQQCSYSGYDGCKPKCLEDKCYCLCAPKVSLQDVKKTVYPIWGKQQSSQKFPSSSVSNSGQLNSTYTVGTPPPPPALY